MTDQYNLSIILPEGEKKIIAFRAGRKLPVEHVRGAKYVLIDAHSGEMVEDFMFVRDGDVLKVFNDTSGGESTVVEIVNFFYAETLEGDASNLAENEVSLDFNNGTYTLTGSGFPIEASGAVVGAVSFSTPLIGALSVGAGVAVLAPRESSSNDSSANVVAIPAAFVSYVDNEGDIRSAVSAEFKTDDSTPGFNIGAVPKGTTPNLYVDDVKVPASYDSVNGTLTPDSALLDGTQSIRYSFTDLLGNESQLSDALVITISAQPVSIVKVVDNQEAVVDEVAQDGVTNDKSPTLEGTGRPGAVVTISEGMQTLGSATVRGDGSWSFTVDNNAAEGKHTYTATQPNAIGAGNTSTSFALTIDTQAPSAPSAVRISDNAGELTGYINNNGATDDTTPTISGKTGDGAQVVNIYNGNTLVGSASVNSNGDWSFTPTVALGAGKFAWSATALDAAGNESLHSSVTSFEVVTDAPAALAIIEVIDNVGAHTGMVAKDASTNDQTLQVKGTSVAGNVVRLLANGTEVGSATADNQGNWSVTTPTLAKGAVSFTALQSNALGQRSPETGAYRVFIDIDAPSKPDLVGTDDVGSRTGEIGSANGQIGTEIDDASPTFSGMGPKGDVIIVRDGSSVLGSTVVQDNGSWSFTPESALVDGDHSISVIAQDAAGNQSEPSGSLSFKVDTSNQPVSISHAVDDTDPVQGNVANNGVTNDTSPALQGTGKPGALVTIKLGSSVLGSTTVSDVGNWSFNLPTQNEGTFTYTAEAMDKTGKPSSATLTLTVDSEAPAAPIGFEFRDDVGTEQGLLQDGDSTDDMTPTLSGVGARSGDVIKVYDNDTVVGSAAVKADGTWSVTTTPLVAGDHVLSVTQTDAAGNESPKSEVFDINFDTTAPNVQTTTVTVNDVTPDNVLNSAESAENVAITGTVAGEFRTGDVVRVTVNGVMTSGTVAADGSFSVNVGGSDLLADAGRQVQVSVAARDGAGNVGHLSDTQSYSTDTQAPDTTAEVTTIVDNVGVIAGTVANGGVTDDTQLGLGGTLSAALGQGESVRIYDGSTFLGTATVSTANNTWTFADTRTLSHNQSVSYTARVADTAGNQSAGGTAYSATVDTQAPNTTVEVTAIVDDVGMVNGTVGAGGLTDDTQLGVSGTLSAALGQGESVRIYDGSTFLGTATVSTANNTWTFADTRTLSHNQSVSYTARVADTAGNQSAGGTAYIATIDTQAPYAQSTALTVDNVTTDNILNTGEITDNITVTGRVTGDFSNGDVLTLNVNDKQFSATVNAQGVFSIAVTAIDLRDDSDKIIGASVRATDAAGNQGTVTATKSYSLNQAPTDSDEKLSATEGVAFTSVNLLANASDSDTTDTLTVTVDSTTGTFASLVKVINGELSINTAHASLEALAAGATSEVKVDYTVSDGRGGSSNSTATITFNGTNDAPVVQIANALISNSGSLYTTRNSLALSITDIDGSPSRVPTNWTAVSGTPDLNDYTNAAWLDIDPAKPGYFYTQANVNGTSTDGGQFVGLQSIRSSGASSDSMSTTIIGLASGNAYTIAVQWQQASLVGGNNEAYYGGQLRVSSEGNVARVYTSDGLTDGWQTALYTFTATGASQAIRFGIDGLNGTLTTGFNYTGGYIVVDSLASSVFETQTYDRSNGVALTTLFPSSYVSDSDGGSLLGGYAILSAANGSTGGWEYSTDGGTNWFSLSNASVSNAFYLAGTDLVRYTGLRGSNTKLEMVMVDNTGPALHGANLQATTIDVSTRGGTTPFSQQVVGLSANASPVLLDLDGDGRISYSVIDGDINVDGLADKANWVAGNDGILFHDKFGDGQLHSMDQFAFAQYGGDTDLEGLAIGFDSNKDGVFDARDAAFDAFKVWQDLNQDGQVDGGELHSLLLVGITSIALKSDGVERSPVAGVTEHGHSQAMLANGSAMLVVDASLDYQHGADLQAHAAEAEQLKTFLVI